MYKENKKGDKSSPWRTPTLQENKNGHQATTCLCYVVMKFILTDILFFERNAIVLTVATDILTRFNQAFRELFFYLIQPQCT